jgi:urease accessory protein
MESANEGDCLVTSAATERAVRPSLRGHLHLVAAADADGCTRIAHQSFRAPFHISKPYWDGAVLQVQVVNPTAGILAGDRLELEITAEPGAALLVTTPAAARAFMMRSGAAQCGQDLRVRAGGWLEYLPEPLYPHRDADYAQATRLEVEAGGEVAYFDALAPGRVGRGERWAWRRLRVSLDVHYGGEPVLRECLDAGGAVLAAAAELHRTPDAFFGTLVLITERLRADDPVWEAVRNLHGGGRWIGATALRRGGWIVRVIAPGGQALRDTVAELRTLFARAMPRMASDLRKL